MNSLVSDSVPENINKMFVDAQRNITSLITLLQGDTINQVLKHMSVTCGEFLQQFQKLVLGVIYQLGSLYHQLTERQVSIQHVPHQLILVVMFDHILFHK